MYRSARINTANAYGMNKAFTPNLRTAIHYHNINKTKLAADEKVQSLLVKIEPLKQTMGRNIRMILESSEKFDTLLDKSQTLNEDASIFRRKSDALKRKNKRKNLLLGAGLTLLLVILLMLGLIGFCGTGLQACRKSSSGGRLLQFLPDIYP
jgi:vesicle-associated membrane protein 7